MSKYPNVPGEYHFKRKVVNLFIRDESFYNVCNYNHLLFYNSILTFENF